MKKVANILAKARNEIAIKGLYKGQLEGPKGKEGPCCIMGAIHRACKRAPESTIIDAVFNALEQVIPETNFNAVQFNDLKTTNKRKVLKKFDEAISLVLSEV